MEHKHELNLSVVIENESNLDQCIRQINASKTLTHCSLHFTCKTLPDEKIIFLKEALLKQINITVLSLTAVVSLELADKIATILGDALNYLTNLTSLTLRGLHADPQTDYLLAHLLDTTTNLSELSVGIYDKKHPDCDVMSEEGAAILAKALVNNKTLTHLDLHGNILKSSGMNTILTSLTKHPSLKILNLSDNIRHGKYSTPFNAHSLLELLDNNMVIEEIYIEDMTFSPSKFSCTLETGEQFEQALRYLSKNKYLKHLKLYVDFEPMSKHLQALASIIKLQPLYELKLYSKYFDFEFFYKQAFMHHKTLTSLTFEGNTEVTEASMTSLIQLINSNTLLSELTFGACGIVSSSPSEFAMNALATAIEHNNTLIHLNLSWNKLADLAIIAGIIRNNQTLKSLNFSNNEFLHSPKKVDLLLKAIAENKSLESLNLNSNQITFSKESVAILEKNKSLTCLKLLKYPGAINPETKRGDWAYYNDYHLENTMDYETYCGIEQVIERNLIIKEKLDYSIFTKPMSKTSNSSDFFKSECQADGVVSSREKGVFVVERASCILLHVQDLELYVNNHAKRSVYLQGNKLTGLNKDAVVLLNSEELKPEMGTLVISKLSPASYSLKDIEEEVRTSMDSRFFKDNPTKKQEVKVILAEHEASQQKIDNAELLCKAAMEGDVKTVKELCEQGVNCNHHSKQFGGSTPAYLAAQNRKIPILKLLKQYDADFNLGDEEGCTPAYIAAQEGYADVITLLGKYGVDLNRPYNGKTPARAALNNGHNNVLHALSHYVDINQLVDKTPLIFYSLLGCGLIKTERLPCSSELRSLPTVYNYILTSDDFYYFKIGDKEPHKVSSFGSHLRKLHEIFPQSVTHVTGIQLKEIQSITKHVHQYDLLETMLLCNADYNATTPDGRPVIFNAVGLGCYEATKILVNYGASLNCVVDEFSLITSAASQGRLDLITLLVENGAEFNLTGPSGLTPLFVAAQNGHVEMVKFLVERPDVNLQAPFISSEASLIRFASSLKEPCLSEMKKLIKSKLIKEAKSTSIEITPSEIALVTGNQESHQIITAAIQNKESKILNLTCINRYESPMMYVTF